MVDFASSDGEGADAGVHKRGENVIYIRFRRASKGILVTAKVVPAVEDMFRSWGTGASSGVEVWGREWKAAGDVPLRAWDLVHNPGPTPIDPQGRVVYVLDRVGRTLHSEESGIQFVNLSFLRCEGISEGAGIQFVCNSGVYSDEAITRLAKDIQQAALSLYRSYLKPVDLAVVVSTQEIKP